MRVADLLSSTSLQRRDAEVLVQHALGCDRSWLFAHSQDELAAEQLARIDTLFQRRAAGEPVAYLTGQRDFWSLSLQVSPDVLIPRPDTETLVEWALQRIESDAAESVLDLGTGSGAIALALKASRPSLQVTAVDKSRQALEQATVNGRKLGLAVEWLHSDWFTAIGERAWPLVVTNPPYIAEDDPHLDQGDLRAEPRMALVSGHDGLTAIRFIIASAPQHLEPGGWLLIEHGYEQASSVRALLGDAGFLQVASRRDLGGHERVTGGCWHAV